MRSQKTGVGIRMIVTIFVVSLALFTTMYISLHEQAHGVIYEETGCSEVETHIGFMDGHTTCSNNTEMTENQRRCGLFLHSINEIVGYQLYVIMVAILFAMVMISLVIVSSRDG